MNAAVLIDVDCHSRLTEKRTGDNYNIHMNVQVHLNKLECRGKVHLFQ